MSTNSRLPGFVGGWAVAAAAGAPGGANADSPKPKSAAGSGADALADAGRLQKDSMPWLSGQSAAGSMAVIEPRPSL